MAPAGVVESPAPRRVRRGAAASRVGAIALAGILALSPSACREVAAEGAAAPLEGSAPSLRVLGDQVLRALARGDTAALRGFRLSRTQHDGTVWPELPASRPGVDYPVDLAWENIELRDRRAVKRLLPVFEGRDPEVRAVECRGARRSFATFHVETDCWVVFDLAGAQGPLEAQLFKDVLVRGGGHKVFRYYEGAPRRVRGGGGGRT